MQLSIPYGKSSLRAVIPDTVQVDFVEPNEKPPTTNPLQEVRSALDNLLGALSLALLSQDQRVAIAVNDKTRPVPHQYLLPPLVEILHEQNIADEQITFIIATGLHPVMPPEEYSWILPKEIIQRYRIICHNAEDNSQLLYLGDSSMGTPVKINKHFMQADYRIVVGNVEPHQFQGYSGGVKSAAIGLAGKETINHNHAMMIESQSRLGEYSNNPARQDVEGIGRMIGVDMALNAVLNDKKEIVRVFAGDPVAVMNAAIPLARETYVISVAEPYELMIVSPGGYPKDINMYQSQKGLAHAMPVIKESGNIILCAACPEGTGSSTYEQWVTHPRIRSHQDVLTYFRDEGFRVGPHKAFQISRDASRVNLVLVSDMDPAFVDLLQLNPAPNLQMALSRVLPGLASNARIGVMTVANSTIPTLV